MSKEAVHALRLAAVYFKALFFRLRIKYEGFATA